MPGAEFRLPNEFAHVPLHGPLRLTGPWVPEDPQDFASVFARAVARWLSTSEEPVTWRRSGGQWAVVGSESAALATGLAAAGCTHTHEGWAVPLTNPYDVANEMFREGVQLPARDAVGWLGRWADRLHEAGFRVSPASEGLEVILPESLDGPSITGWAKRYLPDPALSDPQMFSGDPAVVQNDDIWYGSDADTDQAALSRDTGEGHKRPLAPEPPRTNWDDDGSDGDTLRMVEHAIAMAALGNEMDDHPIALTARRIWDSLGHAAWCDLHPAPFGWRWRPTPTMHRLVAHSLGLWPAQAQDTYGRLDATALDAANHASSVVAAEPDHGQMPRSERELAMRWLDTAGIARLDSKWFTAVPYTRFPRATRLLDAPHAWHYWTVFPNDERLAENEGEPF